MLEALVRYLLYIVHGYVHYTPNSLVWGSLRLAQLCNLQLFQLASQNLTVQAKATLVYTAKFMTSRFISFVASYWFSLSFYDTCYEYH